MTVPAKGGDEMKLIVAVDKNWAIEIGRASCRERV